MKKYKILNGTIGIALSITTLASFVSSGVKLIKEKPLKVSKAIYYKLEQPEYKHNIVYLKEEKVNDYMSFVSDSIDLNLTKSAVENITALTIDASKFDFNDLLLLPHLHTLQISKIDFLTDKDKKIINSLKSLKTVRLNYDFNNMNFNDVIDLKWLDNRQVIIDCEGINLNEDIHSLYIYHIAKNFNNKSNKVKLNIASQEEQKKMEKWDKKINKIIDSLNLNSSMTDYEKLINILCYVTDYYEYDPNVASAIYQDNLKDVYSEVVHYNDVLLGNILDENNRQGVCCNYAALTFILAQYCGINVQYQSGVYDDYGHAWCYYASEDAIIDPTALDNGIVWGLIKDSYMYHKKNHKKYSEEKLNNSKKFVYVDNDTKKRYKLDDYQEFGKNYSSNKIKQIDYQNEKVDDYYYKYVLEPAYIECGIGSTSFLSLILGMTYGYSKRNKKKERELLKR